MDFTIKKIDAARFNDINIPNEPFSIIGKLYPEYNGTWNYHVSLYPNEQRYEMTFPNEHYDYALLSSDSFLWAHIRKMKLVSDWRYFKNPATNISIYMI